VLAAAVLRFVGLSDRPMHHDESLDAWFSWRIWRGEPYRYDPVYHGPLRFYLTAGIFQLLGDGEATARYLAALAGTATVALVGAFRRWIGDVGALVAAALVAISPSVLYFSRFGREDSLMGLLEVALLLVAMSWLTRPSRWHPLAAGALLAAAFATKETTFIVGAVTASYLVALTVAQAWRRRGRAAAPPLTVVRALRGPGGRWWLLGAGAFALVFSALFSVGFTEPGGIVDGAVDGIDYWLSQQPVNRGSMPWPFYVVLLVAYEWPIVLLALGGLVRVARRPTPALGLVAWTAAGNLVVYSWASERFPWLVVHPLLPMLLLAGLAAQRLWDERGTTVLPVAIGAALVLVILGTNAVRVVYREPSNPRQLLSAVQTTDAVPALRDRVESIAAAAPPDAPPRIIVDTTDSATWPWAWYLRDLPVAYVDLAADPGAATGADVVIAMAPNVPALVAPPEGWRAQPFDHRAWWLPDWDHAGAGDWLRWFATRETFNPTGATEGVLLERVGIPGGASSS